MSVKRGIMLAVLAFLAALYMAHAKLYIESSGKCNSTIGPYVRWAGDGGTGPWWEDELFGPNSNPTFALRR
ncbi:MAG: hypothetical protein ABIG61_11850 [Planctomycetota bacterium]